MFQMQLVFLTVRVHLFPFRTQKLSSPVPTILVWRRTGKIGQCQHKGFGVHVKPFDFASLAQQVEHAAVNRRVVGSNPTGGANGIAATFVTAILILGPLAQLVRATGS